MYHRNYKYTIFNKSKYINSIQLNKYISYLIKLNEILNNWHIYHSFLIYTRIFYLNYFLPNLTTAYFITYYLTLRSANSVFKIINEVLYHWHIYYSLVMYHNE